MGNKRRVCCGGRVIFSRRRETPLHCFTARFCLAVNGAGSIAPVAIARDLGTGSRHLDNARKGVRQAVCFCAVGVVLQRRGPLLKRCGTACVSLELLTSLGCDGMCKRRMQPRCGAHNKSSQNLRRRRPSRFSWRVGSDWLGSCTRVARATWWAPRHVKAMGGRTPHDR